MAEDANQPGAAGGQRRLGMRTAGMGLRGARARRDAGGEAGHQALKALGGAVEVGPEPGEDNDETGLARAAPRDQDEESGQDDADPTGEVEGGGLVRGREGRGLHDSISNITSPRTQENNGWGVPRRAVRCGG